MTDLEATTHSVAWQEALKRTGNDISPSVIGNVNKAAKDAALAIAQLKQELTDKGTVSSFADGLANSTFLGVVNAELLKAGIEASARSSSASL